MNLLKNFSGTVILFIGAFFIFSCKTDNYSDIPGLGREPVIEPDYSGVTIPPNIAPMNFIISEDGVFFKIRVTSSNGRQIVLKSSDGIVRFPLKSWKKLLADSKGGKIEIEVISEDKEERVKKYDPVYIECCQ